MVVLVRYSDSNFTQCCDRRCNLLFQFNIQCCEIDEKIYFYSNVCERHACNDTWNVFAQLQPDGFTRKALPCVLSADTHLLPKEMHDPLCTLFSKVTSSLLHLSAFAVSSEETCQTLQKWSHLSTNSSPLNSFESFKKAHMWQKKIQKEKPGADIDCFALGKPILFGRRKSSSFFDTNNKGLIRKYKHLDELCVSVIPCSEAACI